MLSEGTIMFVMMVTFFLCVGTFAIKGNNGVDNVLTRFKEGYTYQHKKHQIQTILKKNEVLFNQINVHFGKLSAIAQGSDFKDIQNQHIVLFDEVEDELLQVIDLLSNNSQVEEGDILRLKQVAVKMADTRKLLIENGAKIMGHFDEQLRLRSKVKEAALEAALETESIKRLNERINTQSIKEQQRMLRENQRDQMQKIDDMRY